MHFRIHRLGLIQFEAREMVEDSHAVDVTLECGVWCAMLSNMPYRNMTWRVCVCVFVWLSNRPLSHIIRHLLCCDEEGCGRRDGVRAIHASHATVLIDESLQVPRLKGRPGVGGMPVLRL